MKWRALAPLVSLAFAAPLLPAVARADTPPSIWDYARDPAERDRWNLHVRVERLMHPPLLDEQGIVGDLRRDGELRLEAARAMLEQADAAHSPDLRLRFDLAGVYRQLAEAQGRDDLYRKAIDILVPAIAAAGDHDPAVTRALEDLVYCYVHLGMPREELAAWRRYIPRLSDGPERVLAMMNMGEAEMRLGQVDDALATFRDVLRRCGELPNTTGVSETYVLTLWDLAVALDRAGDPRGAMDTAARALSMNVLAGSGADLIERNPNVFFVPAWERRWYIALLHAARARDAKDARDAAADWTIAEQQWDAYIRESTAAGGRDPYLAIAKVRRDHVEAERAAAERRAARLPKRPERRGPWLD
jgi:tetratricopeptide (TPR) repeat protein